MSGIQGHVLGHIVRRGVQHFAPVAQPEYVQRLQQDAQLYENSGPEMEVNPWEMLPVFITAFLVILITASVRYTVGEVVASLAMIESQTSTAIIEDKPPAYADEPDAPLEKETLLPTEAVADIEVLLVRNTPITAKLVTSIGHLHRIGGFRARWRGLGASFIYHAVFGSALHLLSTAFVRGMFSQALVYTFVSVATSRLHMLWTHSMIAKPTTTPFWRRIVARKDAKSIIMPALVLALAQQATILIPSTVASVLGVPEMSHEHFVAAAQNKDCHALIFNILRVTAVPASALVVALAVLLPATVTLTRIEALLLPEDQDTIVPFDRQAIIAGVNPDKRCKAGALFTSAWRSFDGASRWRLIKLYLKMAVIQFTVVLVGVHLILAELFVFGGERFVIALKSGAAQMQLAAIEAN